MNRPVTKRARRAASPVPELFSIRILSELTGVNPVTLRAWERRHGLLKPRRTAKGHRLYSRADLELIEQVQALTARGVPIGQVGEVLARVPETSARGGADQPWIAARDRVLEAVARFDEDGLDRVYEGCLGDHPVDVVTQRLIVPTLIELGRRWETAEGSVAEEHFFGTYLRNKLGARFHHRPRNARGPRLVAACWPGELHEVGLLLFALAASDAGFRLVLLGANLPLEELPIAVARSGADAVVLSGTSRPAAETLGRRLPDLVAAVRVPVFCGGLAAARSHDAIVAAGAVPLTAGLGESLGQIAERIARRR
jgi:DNA-binding transcriptional MerR regulator